MDDYNAPTLRPSRLNTAAQQITSNVLAKFVQPSPLPIRVEAGGLDYLDPQNRFWTSDFDYTGGSVQSTTSPISNTNTPTLYQSARAGSSFAYQFAVPNGTHVANLKFAEIVYTAAGQRMFNVSINGSPVLTNFDIVAHSGGPLIAFDQSFPGTVSRGQIAIQFTSGPAGVPLVNGIEITQPSAAITVLLNPRSVTMSTSQIMPFTATLTGASNTGVTWSMSPSVGTLSTTGLYTAPATISSSQTVSVTATSVADPTKSATAMVTLTPPTTFAPVRVNAGAGAYTDLLGQVWSADTGFTGGNTWCCSGPVSNTTTPALYQSYRYGNYFSYQFSVPTGTYTVTLKFAETYYASAGKRTFNVSTNGSPVLSNFDIAAQAGGPLIAVDKTFSITVSDGLITIQFSPGSVDLPLVNAIEIK